MLELIGGAVFESEANEVDAVRVSNKVIVKKMVIRLSGELPHAKLSHRPEGALKSC